VLNIYMNWILLGEIAYTLVIISVCLHIIYNTPSTTKTLAYVLVVIFLPLVGIGIHLMFGANYRKNKLYSKKIANDSNLLSSVRKRINLESEKAWDTAEPEVQKHKKLARFLLNDSDSPLTANNDVKLLLNGEEKFPAVIEALKGARHHIHMEYYIFEDEVIGNQVAEILMQKAREGVQVRVIYDDFGSRSIRKKMVPALREAGVQAYPFFKVYFILLANRVNYRNHRKIIIVDGCIGFTGGINISDRYINGGHNTWQRYWRDTHVMISGPGVYFLQYLFICDWNFCADEQLPITEDYFCTTPGKGKAMVQIAASGPDSDTPTIMFSLLQAIALAENEILITTPYFIPGENILDALNVAAISGVKVKILVPGKGDSAFVDAAARSYYAELLDSGVEVYLYKKGFVHAKTLVSDGQLSIIGTANMDHRSFELNFEVNSMIYDEAISQQLRNAFYNDLKYAERIDPERWNNRKIYRQLPERIARLVSPLL
jgi:cardiolipin synthase